MEGGERGERWDLLAALSTGGGRGPRGWHSVTFNPRPPSAAPHSNNRHCRFGGRTRGKERVGGGWVEGGWQRWIRGGGPTEGEFRPAEAHLDRLGLSKGGRGIPLPPLPTRGRPHPPLVVLSSFVLPLPRGSLSKAPNASGARIHVYVTLRARICGMARGCYGDPPSARG